MRRRTAATCQPPPPDDIRCRRSNGKDWRCAEQALPELSYCAYHHHLNYHRPQSDGKVTGPVGNRVSKPKRKGNVLNSDHVQFSGMMQAPPIQRRKKRRREEVFEQPEMGFTNLSSNQIDLIPQLTDPLHSPIYDALPVRFRPSNSLVNLLSTEEDQFDIYNSVPIPVQIPVSVPVSVSDDLRCRRSNGKEWRCSEQALPGLSYCPYHHNLNYNRSGTKHSKPRNNSRGTSRVILERNNNNNNNNNSNNNNNNNNNDNGGLCKRTNGKGWRCPNFAVEGLSYCPYHHQLNYRGTNNNDNINENNNDVDLGNVGTSGGTKMRDVGIIGLDGLLVKTPRNRKTWFI